MTGLNQLLSLSSRVYSRGDPEIIDTGLLWFGVPNRAMTGVDRIYPLGYSEKNSNMKLEEKKQLEMTLKRIQGQVGGISKMIDEEKECSEVLTQVVAAMSSLKTVGMNLLADQASCCSKTDYIKLLKRFV